MGDRVVKSQEPFWRQTFLAEMARLVENNCREIGFPRHTLLHCWGRRDVIVIRLSRTLLAWEAALAENQERETAQAKLWRNPAVVALLLSRWDSYCRKSFDVPVKKLNCMSRFVVEGQEFGYEVIELSRPLFPEPFDSSTKPADRNNRAPARFPQYWPEDRLNVEFCRLLREIGGKGPERCRVMMLDDQHLLLLLAGVLTEGQLDITDHEPKLATSLENIIKRQLWVCTQKLLRELGARSKRVQIELNLEHNEAVVLVLV
jgi:hypothetical protein